MLSGLAVRPGDQADGDLGLTVTGGQGLHKAEDTAARLRCEVTLTWRPSSRHNRWTFSLLTSRRSS